MKGAASMEPSSVRLLSPCEDVEFAERRVLAAIIVFSPHSAIFFCLAVLSSHSLLSRRVSPFDDSDRVSSPGRGRLGFPGPSRHHEILARQADSGPSAVASVWFCCTTA